METTLHWAKEAFNREVVITDGQRPVGRLYREVLARDVSAYLNDVRLWFDVEGFLIQEVTVHQYIGDTDQVIGHIRFDWDRSAELELTNGRKYRWKRQNFLMHEWSILSEDPAQQEIIHYDQTKMFFGDEGRIELLRHSPNAEVLILAGLFVRNYFLRKRRIATAG